MNPLNAARKPRVRKTPLPDKLFAPSERDIENTCTELLGYDGWRCIKTDLPHLRGLGVQEKGMADRLYIRYGARADTVPPGGACLDIRRAATESFWVEWKKVGGKNAVHQKAWQAAERGRGAIVWVSLEDFPATIEGFKDHYRKSGLNRGRV